jgi:hypothetical protein
VNARLAAGGGAEGAPVYRQRMQWLLGIAIDARCEPGGARCGDAPGDTTHLAQQLNLCYTGNVRNDKSPGYYPGIAHSQCAVEARQQKDRYCRGPSAACLARWACSLAAYMSEFRLVGAVMAEACGLTSLLLQGQCYSSMCMRQTEIDALRRAQLH